MDAAAEGYGRVTEPEQTGPADSRGRRSGVPGAARLRTGQPAPWNEAMSAQWEQLPPPDVSPGPMWSRAPRTAAELTAMRRQLYTALRAGPLAIAADADAVETVLLVFEELASNGLRHGRPPVQVTVAAAGTGWLLEVSDAAGDRPPIAAVGRDPAHGGLGLHMVARLSAAHGWIARDGRKHVWVHVTPADPADSAAG